MAKKTTVDKWKTKKWVELVAPPIFQNKVIGETFSSNPKNIPGRVMLINLGEIAGTDPRRQKIKLKFRVDKVEGEKAFTTFLGHIVPYSYERSLVRRRTSKVYVNQQVITKDNQNLTVKAFAVTAKQVNKAKQSTIAKKFREFLLQEAKNQKFNDFINSILSNKLGMKSKIALRKIYPIKQAVIQKTEIIESVKPAQ